MMLRLFWIGAVIGILVAAVTILAALLTRPASAATGTQPPNAVPPDSSTRVGICHYDSNAGYVFPEVVPPDQAPTDRGIATEGHDTLAPESRLCQQSPDATPSLPTAVRRLSTATPTATVLHVERTPTVESTWTPWPTWAPTETPEPEPTDTPTPTPTLVPEPEPTWGPLPACSPDQPPWFACGGK